MPKLASNCNPSLFYYMSFDSEITPTDGPIPERLDYHQWHSIKTFDYSGNGKVFSVYPPSGWGDVGSPGIPDFIATFYGVKHAVAWDEEIYPAWGWNNFVTTPQNYSTSFNIMIEGPTQLAYNQTFEYIVNINGGHGEYGIFWEYRELSSSIWNPIKDNPTPAKYFDINVGGTVHRRYRYSDEYRCNFTMGISPIELRVTVYDLYSEVELFTSMLIYPTPEPVRLINRINNTTNFGSLILNEDKLNPISSNSQAYLTLGLPYSVRTNVVPFMPNWSGSGSTQKHHRWEFNPAEHLLNHNFTFQPSTQRTMISAFEQTAVSRVNCTVDLVELGGINLNFKDPWHYYQNSGNWYQHTDYLPYSSPLILENNSTNSYGGVFLNQTPDPNNPNKPYYSVQAITGQSINIGGVNRPLYFQNWTANPPASAQFNNPNGLTSGVVFKDPGVSVQANFKGHMLSNNTAASGSNGQRKLMRDQYGIYHLVYSSMNRLWYTKSLTTDYGGSWTPEVDLNGDYDPDNEIRNPSMDIMGDTIALVFEIKQANNYALFLFRLPVNIIPTGTLSEVSEIATIDANCFGSALPVVAYTKRPINNSNEIFILYRTSITGSLKYSRRHYVAGVLTESENGVSLSGTTTQSRNPSVAGSKTTHKIFIVYEDAQRFIKHIESDHDYINSERDFASTETISTGSGYYYNYSPSISLFGQPGDSYRPIVSWTSMDNRASKLTEEQSVVPTKICVRPNSGAYTWGSILMVGSQVSISQNSSTSNTNGESVIVWSENAGASNKWIKRIKGTYNTTKCLSPSGKGLLISNGSGLTNMKALVFNENALPYSFNKSADNFNLNIECGSGGGGLNKITEAGGITFGRSGLVLKNGVEFIFNIGDVVVNDSIIQFIERNDTIQYQSTAELNEVVRTYTFELDNDADFIFSNRYFVNNAEFADTSLTSDDAISFKAELVNSSTGNVTGTFDEITFTKNNLSEYENIAYEVNCAGIQSGEYYLRLVTNVSGEAEYNLANVQSDAANLEKKTFTTIYFDGRGLPQTYDISQNYPNPFNPSTVINYQIPNDGLVTIKVYDILGKEVTTLVNENKSIGRYSVQFDGNNLASGVYIYRITSGDFVSSKKMMLIK